jgi:hypothetical protein
MGVWSLQKYGIKFHLSTNRAESFNSLVKRRFVKPRNYGEDDIIFGSSEPVLRQVLRIRRARYGIGENWLLREEFRHLYDINCEEKFKPDDNEDQHELDTDQIRSQGVLLV